MNKTKIDWVKGTDNKQGYTWNPVTGCLYGCKYCYAKKIANRFGLHQESSSIKVLDEKYVIEDNCIMTGEKTIISSPYPYDFAPTFHRYRLDEPLKKRKGVNIFVCSMADLFADWIPDEWIKEVFETCKRAPQHRYLFLTKNPDRYIDLYEKKLLPYKENIWLGTTVTIPTDEFVFFRDTPYKSFISIEPILEPFGELARGEMPQWVIVGAETGNRKDKVIPKKEWILSIKEQCKGAGVPIFMKESLRELMSDEFIQEFPW